MKISDEFYKNPFAHEASSWRKFDEKKFLVGTVDKCYVSLRISKTLIESKGNGLKEITKRGEGSGHQISTGLIMNEC